VSLPSVVLVDDFLANPRDLRQRALALGYDRAAQHGNYSGVTSDRAIEIPGLDETVSRLIGVPVQAAPGTLHGHCRIAMASDRGASGVHIDPAYFSGILYLSPPEHARGGTDFYRHRRTGLDRVPMTDDGLVRAGYGDINALIEDVVNRDTLKPSAWERTMSLPMRFNRLALFSPWLFHNSRPGFGTTPETGRLVYLMFFAARSSAPMSLDP
jgi:hypothetical protein